LRSPQRFRDAGAGWRTTNACAAAGAHDAPVLRSTARQSSSAADGALARAGLHYPQRRSRSVAHHRRRARASNSSVLAASPVPVAVLQERFEPFSTSGAGEDQQRVVHGPEGDGRGTRVARPPDFFLRVRVLTGTDRADATRA
jgi:hypothetical protein